jgi:DNA-binding winged helix-turn-helix (wHTH) protein
LEMAGDTDQSRTVRFGAFEVDVRTGELRKNGLKIKLQDQPFRVLIILLRHAGDVVMREELRRELWPNDTFVDFDHGLNAAVRRLRDALDDSAENPRFIETLPRHGYRFITTTLRNPIQPETPASPLRRWSVPVLAALSLIALALFVWGRDNPRGTGLFRTVVQPQIRSLAVLPFTNISGDPQHESFADGMTEALITELSRIGPLRVISQTSRA